MICKICKQEIRRPLRDEEAQGVCMMCWVMAQAGQFIEEDARVLYERNSY